MPRVSTIFRIILAATATIFPIAFAREIEAKNWVFLLAFGVLATLVAAVEIYFDWKSAADRDKMQLQLEHEIKREQNRLEFQQARGVTMAQLLEVLTPLMGVVTNIAIFTDQEKERAAEKFDDAGRQILKAACNEVKAYYNEKRNLRVSASLLLAYPILKAPVEVKKRTNLDFVEFGREDLSSYHHLLDMTLIAGDGVAGFANIALPVENPARPEGKRKLLPGAPSAFYLGENIIWLLVLLRSCWNH